MATLRKLQQDCLLYEAEGQPAPPFHHGVPQQHRYKGSDVLTQVTVSDLQQSEQPSTLVEFLQKNQVLPCSRLNYYSQREPFIRSDTAGIFLGEQLYCCVRLTQTVVICNKDKKIALVL